MIKHIVMWQIKDQAEGRSKAENAQLVQEMAAQLQRDIPEIHYMEVGRNLREGDDIYDLVMYSEFIDQDARKKYAVDPHHKKFSEYLAKIKTKTVIADYEVVAS